MSVSPDQGMQFLYPAAAPPPASPAGDPPLPGPGGGPAGELDVMARLAVSLDGISAALKRSDARRERARLSWEQCHLIDIPPGQSAAAGVLDQPDEWGPMQGWVWQVLLIPAILGPAGTSMTLYRDAPVPTSTIFSATTSGLFEPKGLLLMPGRRLVWSSAGDALTVCTGIACEIAIDRLPDYLM